MEESIKELLKLLFKEVESYGNYMEDLEEGEPIGLCYISEDLVEQGIISIDEESIVDEYIKNHRPIWKNNEWGWEPGLKEPRVEWLKLHINKLCKK